MRTIKNFILLAGCFGALVACDKTETLRVFGTGTEPVLAASVMSVAPTPADSNNLALTLSWSYPGHATDSTNIKYTIEIDSAGKNFSNPSRVVVPAALKKDFIAKELNTILLARGYAFNVEVDMDVRVVSSYGNNNEQLNSNVLRIKMKPYNVPPKVVPPSSNTLFLVGSATAGGWGNPVPLPAQSFTRLDSVTYEGTFYLNGGAEYLMLPVNGDWSHKFSVADNTVVGLNEGGDFGADLSNNFPGPSKTGLYKIRVDFQAGKFTVTQEKLFGLLYVPGDYQGWNPATASTLGSPNNDGNYEGYINFPAGGTFEFKFTTTPDWSNALGDGGGGTLSSSGGNLTVPGAGYYRILGNTNNNTWSATATSWSMIGDFNGWGSDADMTYNASEKTWTGTINVPSNGGFKFRANHDWGLNLGDNDANGSMEVNGANINITAGTHTVTIFLNNSGYFTYKIQ